MATYHDPRTQQLLIMLLNSSKGREFVDFLLQAGTRFGGDTYITWGDLNCGDYSDCGYTTSGGMIVLDVGMLQTSPISSYTTDVTEGDYLTKLVSAAGILVHEAVESYFALAYLFKTPASQEMDYVASWFQGEVVSQLNTAMEAKAPYGIYEDSTRLGSYGQTFSQWIHTPGNPFTSQPTDRDQPILAEIEAGILLGPQGGWVNPMGLTLGMLVGPLNPNYSIPSGS